MTTIGEGWLDAVPILQVLCLGGAFMPFYTLYQNLVISHGRSDINMWLNILQIVIQLAIVIAVSHLGVLPMVTVYTAFNILWLATWQMAAHRLTGLRFRHVVADLLPFLAASAVVMVVTHYATLWLTIAPVLLLARMVLAAVLYLLILKLAHAQILEECLHYVSPKKRKP